MVGQRAMQDVGLLHGYPTKRDGWKLQYYSFGIVESRVGKSERSLKPVEGPDQAMRSCGKQMPVHSLSTVHVLLEYVNFGSSFLPEEKRQ